MSDRSSSTGYRAYIDHNREAIMRDVSVALLWTATVAFLVERMDWPMWSFFLIYFGLWAIYLQAVPSWESPE